MKSTPQWITAATVEVNNEVHLVKGNFSTAKSVNALLSAKKLTH